jgi:hypothetical protein
LARQVGEGRAGLSPDNCRANEPGNLSIRQSRGLPAPLSGLLKAATSLLSVVLLIAVAGCGGGEGVASGATVTAYVVRPLCAEAEGELEREKGRAGDLRVNAVCLPPVESHRRLKLSVIGANARRATEDSTAIAFLEPLGKSGSFSHPILETAEIPWVASSSGKTAMAQLLKAIDRAGSSDSLRSSLSDELG